MTAELRILIVDDSDGCRDLYSDWLADDHEIETAANGTIALDMIGTHIDLVLMDRSMPGPNGLEVAAEMRDDGYENTIIIVSSQERDFTITFSPVDGYHRKPVDQWKMQETAARVSTQQAYETALEEYFTASAALAAVETERGDSKEYAELTDRVEEKRKEVDELLDEDTLDWQTAFSALDTPRVPPTPAVDEQHSVQGQHP